jgi:hypothetical protein
LLELSPLGNDTVVFDEGIKQRQIHGIPRLSWHTEMLDGTMVLSEH